MNGEGEKYAAAEGLLLLSAMQVWVLVSCKISRSADFTRDVLVPIVCSVQGVSPSDAHLHT